jgi:hypothetical protein
MAGGTIYVNELNPDNIIVVILFIKLPSLASNSTFLLWRAET